MYKRQLLGWPPSWCCAFVQIRIENNGIPWPATSYSTSCLTKIQLTRHACCSNRLASGCQNDCVTRFKNYEYNKKNETLLRRLRVAGMFIFYSVFRRDIFFFFGCSKVTFFDSSVCSSPTLWVWARFVVLGCSYPKACIPITYY